VVGYQSKNVSTVSRHLLQKLFLRLVSTARNTVIALIIIIGITIDIVIIVIVYRNLSRGGRNTLLQAARGRTILNGKVLFINTTKYI
jgi:hypothetical protein